MPWTAAAIVGGALIGGAATNSAAKKGAGAADAATRLQYEQYQQQRQDQAPWREAGELALNQLVSGIGGAPGGKLGSATTPEQNSANFDAAAYLRDNPDVASSSFANNPLEHYRKFGVHEGRDFTFTQEAQQAFDAERAQSPGEAPTNDFNRSFTLADFEKDPGYDFRLQQGLDSVQGSRAARGSMLSGATLKALNDYGSNYASSEYGKAYDRFNNDNTQRFNRLATIAGIGQTATNNVGTAGSNYANQAGSNAMAGANASAAGTIGTANSINSGLSNLQSLYYLNNRGGNHGYTSGGNPNGYYEADGSGGSVYVP